MGKSCPKCGEVYRFSDAPYQHTNCDENFQEETWTSPEEIQARAELLERQKRIKNGPSRAEWLPKFEESMRKLNGKVKTK